MIQTTRTQSHDHHQEAADETGAELDVLYRRHREVVRRAIRRALRRHGVPLDPERMEDLEQEVWCRLLERRRARRPGPRGLVEGETIRYLSRVTESVVVDTMRAVSAAKRRPARLIGLDGPGEPGPRLADRRSCPESGLLAREDLRRYFALCRTLLGRREVGVRLRIVRLAWLGGYTSGEIAARVGQGWTAGGVDSLLYRLRRRLAGRGERLPTRSPA